MSLTNIFTEGGKIANISTYKYLDLNHTIIHQMCVTVCVCPSVIIPDSFENYRSHGRQNWWDGVSRSGAEEV